MFFFGWSIHRSGSNAINIQYVLISYCWLSLLLRVVDALHPNEVSMGTTILAVRYKDGVVVGADTRTSVSGYVSNRYAAKLTFVLDRNVDNFVTSSSSSSSNNNNADGGQTLEPDNVVSTAVEAASTCVVCRSGSAADTQHLASIIRSELVSRQILYRIPGTITHVASLLHNILVDNKDDLSASLICAGYDHEMDRGVIYTISPGGTVFEETSWAAGGSGSTYILGHLDSCHPKGIDDKAEVILQTEEEALAFVSNAIGIAMDRDGSSGGFIRMYVINRSGKRFVAVSRNKSKKEEKERRAAGGSALSLKHFAPPIISTPSISQ